MSHAKIMYAKIMHTKIMAGLAMAACMLAVSALALVAQNWPSRPVKLMLPLGPAPGPTLARG